MTKISDDVRAADSIAKIANEMAHYDWVMPPPIEIWAQRLRALPSLAELGRDAADAARYRWLREGAWGGGNDQFLAMVRSDTPELLDAAIDAARASEARR